MLFVSLHVVDNVILTLAHASIKNMPKIGTENLKEIYSTYVQKTSKIFLHDYPHQKKSFLNLIACHIHHPSEIWNEKSDNDKNLKFKFTR